MSSRGRPINECSARDVRQFVPQFRFDYYYQHHVCKRYVQFFITVFSVIKRKISWLSALLSSLEG